MNDTDRASRAVRAKQITEDELFIEAFAQCERDAIEDMIGIWPPDRDKLVDRVAEIRAIRNARQAIEAVMRDGPDMAARKARLKTVV